MTALELFLFLEVLHCPGLNEGTLSCVLFEERGRGELYEALLWLIRAGVDEWQGGQRLEEEGFGALVWALIFEVLDFSDAFGAVYFVAGSLAGVHFFFYLVADGAFVMLESAVVGDVAVGTQANGYFCGF